MIFNVLPNPPEEDRPLLRRAGPIKTEYCLGFRCRRNSSRQKKASRPKPGCFILFSSLSMLALRSASRPERREHYILLFFIIKLQQILRVAQYFIFIFAAYHIVFKLLHTGTGRNEVSGDHVFFQTPHVIGFTRNCCL